MNRLPDEMPTLPLQDMSERHHALTPPVASSYLEAATVCLDKHHRSPSEFTIEEGTEEMRTTVKWEEPTDRIKGAWANTDDATRDGAYAMAIAGIEIQAQLFAVRRAETKTGADYYIGPADQEMDDLENCFRLEVSGTHLDKSEVKSRLRKKLEQAKKGKSNLPALAAIIGFRVQLILL